MTTKEREDLLWSLANQVRAGEGSARLTDRDLEKYRSGSLEPENEKEIELALARDRKARERLAKLAGVKLPTPSIELRERVLRARPRGAGTKTPFPWQRWWPGYAAAMATLLLLFVPLLRPVSLPTDLDFDLHARGLSSARGHSQERSSPISVVKAHLDTRVQVRIEPRGEATSGLHFSLYRHDGAVLRRLPTETPLSLEVVRGAAIFEAPAEALAGKHPGHFNFFFVVHRPGDAPAAEMELKGSDPMAALREGQRRRVYSWQLHLLSATSDEQSLEEEI